MGVPMECELTEEITALMSMDLDGLLDAGSQSRMRQHLASCSTCRVEYMAIQHMSALLESSEMANPPPGFAVRVERRLDERARKRQRVFGGLALLTGSLSLAGTALAATAVIVLVLVVWLWPGSQPALQQSGNQLSQFAGAVGVMGREMVVFLKDLFLHCGVPWFLLAGTALAFLSVIWACLFSRQPGRRVANGQ